MRHTAQSLALLSDARIVGDGSVCVDAVCTVNERRSGAVFPVLKSKYAVRLEQGEVAITWPEMAASGRLGSAGTLLVHAHPIAVLAKVIDVFFPDERAAQTGGRVHRSAVVDAAAEVDGTAVIGAGAVIEAGVRIGEGSVVGPRAVIHRNTRVGRFVVIGSGAVIGYEGFGVVVVESKMVKVPQVGWVEIGDFVEIGANTCIDRGTIGCTVVGEGSRIDNLVQIGHNARIGKNVIIAAQTGLAGSTIVEDGAMLGGQVGVADHLRIGAGARVGAKSGVIGDVAPHQTVSGYPAMARWQWLRVIAKLKK